MYPDRQNLDRELADDQLRIIGVEFNIREPDGRLHEMAMFVPNGTGLILPRLVSGRDFYSPGYEYRPLITFHSTVGDYTIGQNSGACPWLHMGRNRYFNLEWIPRVPFIDEYFTYHRGQHLALIEPTGGGKTRIKYQLLKRAMELCPQLRVKVTIPKRLVLEAPAYNAALGLAETPTWPPAPRRFWEKEPTGYAVWPKHLLGRPDEDPDMVLQRNRAHIEAIMKAAALDSLEKGDVIHDADDIYVQAVVLGMNEFFSEMLTDGRELGCGLWGANQKPSGTRDGSVTSFFYSAPSHLFLGADPDGRNRQRAGEIGGVDPKYISNVVEHLEVHQFGEHAISDKLYVCKAQSGPEGPAMCIVGPLLGWFLPIKVRSGPAGSVYAGRDAERTGPLRTGRLGG